MRGSGSPKTRLRPPRIVRMSAGNALVPDWDETRQFPINPPGPTWSEGAADPPRVCSGGVRQR